MAKKKTAGNKPPDIRILIENVLTNIQAVKMGERVNLDYIISFQVGMALGKGLAPLLTTDDHQQGFVAGLTAHFSFALDKLDTHDKDPPSSSDAEEEINGDNLPF